MSRQHKVDAQMPRARPYNGKELQLDRDKKQQITGSTGERSSVKFPQRETELRRSEGHLLRKNMNNLNVNCKKKDWRGQPFNSVMSLCCRNSRRRIRRDESESGPRLLLP
ncbi:uncharacterized protein V6R79_003776 [Siganus canaliculatus]